MAIMYTVIKLGYELLITTLIILILTLGISAFNPTPTVSKTMALVFISVRGLTRGQLQVLTGISYFSKLMALLFKIIQAHSLPKILPHVGYTWQPDKIQVGE